jgi:hypothetical protein
MNEERKKEGLVEKSSTPPNPASHQVRLPGWLVREEVGLGDVIKRVTYRVGIKPCTGCEKRAAILNRWMSFSRR